MHSQQFVVAEKVVQAFDKRCYHLLSSSVSPRVWACCRTALSRCTRCSTSVGARRSSCLART
jgi:hypothetical protein